MPRKYNLNICRSGETNTNYILPTTDNSAAGSYTCSVTVSTIASADSTGYMVTATGLFLDMVRVIYLHVFHQVMEYLNNLNFANKLFQTFTSMQNRIGKRLIFLFSQLPLLQLLKKTLP